MQADSLRIELSGKESEYNAYFYSFTGTCAVLSHSVVSDSVTPWTVAHQALLSMGFSRQECWSGLPFPFPGDLPNPGIERGSPALQADDLPTEL